MMMMMMMMMMMTIMLLMCGSLVCYSYRDYITCKTSHDFARREVFFIDV